MPSFAIWQGLAAQEVSGAVNVLESPEVTVTDMSTGGNAALKADRDGVSGMTNPFTAGADGSISFYVKPGRYRITATKLSDTVIWEDVLIGPQDNIALDLFFSVYFGAI